MLTRFSAIAGLVMLAAAGAAHAEDVPNSYGGQFLGSTPYIGDFSQGFQIPVGTYQGRFVAIQLVPEGGDFIVDQLQIIFGNNTQQYVQQMYVNGYNPATIYLNQNPGYYGRYVQYIYVSGRKANHWGGPVRLDVYGLR